MANLVLRPYQQKGLDDLRNAFARGLKRVVFKLPTGGGKTELAKAIVNSSVSKGKRVAFVCNRIELINQTSRRFFAAGIQHGVMQGANSRDIHSQVMICSIQTISRRKAQDFDLIIIDEAHGVAGSTAYKSLIFSLNNVPVVGLTATPYSKGMAKYYEELKGPLFQELVVGATIANLIEDSFLVDVDIYAPDAYQPDLSNVKIVAGDYDEAQLAEAVDKPKLIGDIVAHWKKLGRGKPTIVFATNIAHSKHICKSFNEAGIKAEHVDYMVSDEDRTAILDRVRRHETTVLCNPALLAEGLDIPQLEVMILARPTKSLIRYIQQAGRILRPFDGKHRALILDHSGTCAKLGFPTDDHEIPLCDGKPKKESESKPREKQPKVCTSCGYLKDIGVHACPSCGFAPEKSGEIETEEGELKPMARKDRNALPMSVKQAIYSALIGWALSKGMKVGVAYYKYEEMMGAFPPNTLKKEAGPMVESVANWLKHKSIAYAHSKKKAHKEIKCPRCGSHDYKVSAGTGPHARRADCNQCGGMWWLAKEAA